jgi:hypothetical protein
MGSFVQITLYNKRIGYISIDKIDCVLEQPDGKVLIITSGKNEILCDMSIKEFSDRMKWS